MNLSVRSLRLRLNQMCPTATVVLQSEYIASLLIYAQIWMPCYITMQHLLGFIMHEIYAYTNTNNIVSCLGRFLVVVTRRLCLDLHAS